MKKGSRKRLIDQYTPEGMPVLNQALGICPAGCGQFHRPTREITLGLSSYEVTCPTCGERFQCPVATEKELRAMHRAGALPAFDKGQIVKFVDLMNDREAFAHRLAALDPKAGR